MISHREYWNEKRTGLWSEIWETVTLKKYTGEKDPQKESKEQLEGKGAAEICCQRSKELRHGKVEGAGYSITYRVQLSEGS